MAQAKSSSNHFLRLAAFSLRASAEFCQVRINAARERSAVLRLLRRFTSVQRGLAVAPLVKRQRQFRVDALPLTFSVLRVAQMIRTRYKGAFNVRDIPPASDLACGNVSALVALLY